ncbi:membrane-associated 30 kDa protein, chloroplastic [Cocos nucifera]|nr:membrane-associated 30 kDa protein, chloroplastic [Cocos nucifera]
MFKVIASQKRLENKYKAAQQQSDDWYRRAQLALAKGDEDLAREALKRRKSYAVGMVLLQPLLQRQVVQDEIIEAFVNGHAELSSPKVCPEKFCVQDNASSLKAQLDQQKSVVDNLVSNTRLLESKIQEARSKKDTLKARAQSAKTATKVSEMLGDVNTSNALSAFEKMEEKVMAMESQAEAVGQLTTDDLEGKFALLENSSVDDDLASLKRELSGSLPKGELPSGRAVSSSSTALPFKDMEIERELNELRRQAKEY